MYMHMQTCMKHKFAYKGPRSQCQLRTQDDAKSASIEPADFKKGTPGAGR